MLAWHFEEGGTRWTATLQVVPDTPTDTGVELVFVGDTSGAGAQRYAWPLDREALDALRGRGEDLNADYLRRLLSRARDSGARIRTNGFGSSGPGAFDRPF